MDLEKFEETVAIPKSPNLDEFTQRLSSFITVSRAGRYSICANAIVHTPSSIPGDSSLRKAHSNTFDTTQELGLEFLLVIALGASGFVSNNPLMHWWRHAHGDPSPIQPGTETPFRGASVNVGGGPKAERRPIVPVVVINSLANFIIVMIVVWLTEGSHVTTAELLNTRQPSPEGTEVPLSLVPPPHHTSQQPTCMLSSAVHVLRTHSPLCLLSSSPRVLSSSLTRVRRTHTHPLSLVFPVCACFRPSSSTFTVLTPPLPPHLQEVPTLKHVYHVYYNSIVSCRSQHAGAPSTSLKDIPAIPVSAFAAAVLEYEESSEMDDDGDMLIA
ncbi:uncharacterized protein LACBIDRAFT_330289 [Laccaria bicolor S238N-H82]|uniref:Predicted protein n=1 Tax=Laccaria bicolor (strain S238N-H82 / ATCC MYA-4686) TaxID=486041 RepID=B0DKT8_LACBS|nr:uncharacterized protein LACBIDRAFT_330289 [Laccaria bicolor S238N-H82]EDR04796.1 predicted protein [Laccaria bicolor S238N-H82]|eukprot:XP_001884620.1 predicted protein [Laccaria bicolor S238N-H82]